MKKKNTRIYYYDYIFSYFVEIVYVKKCLFFMTDSCIYIATYIMES